MIGPGDVDQCLLGNGAREIVVDGERTRVRYVVADAFDALAKEKQAIGRKDRAGLLRYLASQLRGGGQPSKRSIAKTRKEIDEVRRRIEQPNTSAGVGGSSFRHTPVDAESAR